MLSGKLYQSAIIINEGNCRSNFSAHHFQNGFELIYSKESKDDNLNANGINNVDDDRLILIRMNSSHAFMHEKKAMQAEKKNTIAVYFEGRIFSEAFSNAGETEQLNRLFAFAQNGISITGDTKRKAVVQLKKLITADGLDKIICLLNLLNSIITGNEIHHLHCKISIHKLQNKTGRLANIFDYINSNLKKNIALKDIAKTANLTPESFCRYFKQKTGKKFIDYLHELRLNTAKKMLINTDSTIAEIAYQSGFKTASNFNKLFKKKTGFCPTEFRKLAD